MSAYHLYDTWIRKIQELLPDERVTRIRNVAWMVVGLFLSQSAQLSGIARKLPLAARLPSTTGRFRRFLNNGAFRVRPWYRPLATQLLAGAVLCGTVRLIVDGTKISAGHQLLMVALAYRKRALPIAWTWVRTARGHSTARKQLALLEYVHSLLPANVRVVLVGDCEFGTVAVARRADGWGWDYVLRKQSSTQVCISRSALTWCDLCTLVTQRDKVAWYKHAVVTIKHLYHAKLLGYWGTGEKEPWLLMTNLAQARLALRSYRRRMWIEEMFGDWKGHDVDIEKTHLCRFSRLSRLVFLVALLYLWLVARGAQTIKSGARCLVDRPNRRDLSVFRIGLYIIDRYVARSQTFALRLIPYF
jgi:hypothetical protein